MAISLAQLPPSSVTLFVGVQTYVFSHHGNSQIDVSLADQRTHVWVV